MPDGSAPKRATRSAQKGAAARGPSAKGARSAERQAPSTKRPRAPKPAVVAKLAARAQAISTGAGNKLAGAMRELVYAAAGVTGFAVETARDVVQFLVRRGQMAQEEGERLLREAEAVSKRRVAAGRVPQVAAGPAGGAKVAKTAGKTAAKRARKKAAKRGDAADAREPAALGESSVDEAHPVGGGAKRAARRTEGRSPAKKAARKKARSAGGEPAGGAEAEPRGGQKSASGRVG